MATKNNQFLLSESCQYQDLSWLEHDGEQTIMYRVATDSYEKPALDCFI